jgi:hypothetical protein
MLLSVKVETLRSIVPFNFFRRCFGLIVCLACFGTPIFAQQDSFADRLPPDTLAVFEWHGTASLAPASQANPLLKLWADPAFASLREQWIRDFQASSKPDSTGSKFSVEEFKELISLSENHFAAGVIGEEFLETSDTKSAHGHFLVFDTTGKLDILQKLRAKAEKASPNAAPVASFVVDSVTIEKIAEPKHAYYQALIGNLYLRSDSLEVMQELVPRLRSVDLPAASLARTAEYQETRPSAPVATLAEFFVHVPDVREIKIPPNPKFDTAAFIRALHVEQLHAVQGNLSFTPEAAHIHGVVMGDTASGGIFDILGADSAKFATLPLAPAGSSYSGSKFNLSALYQLVRAALQAAMPPAQAAGINQFDSMISLSLGMPLPDALQLFNGEYAQISEAFSLEPSEGLYVATVHDPDKLLNLLRHVLASMLTTEDREADTTFLEIAVPYADPKTGMRRRRFRVVAVSQDFLLVGSRKAAVREALARLSGTANPPAAGRLADDPAFVRARAAFPEKLGGFAYADLSHVAWDKMVSGIVTQAEESAQRSGKPVDPSIESLKKLDVSSLSQYLHVMSGGTWKQPNGIYFDLYVQ